MSSRHFLFIFLCLIGLLPLSAPVQAQSGRTFLSNFYKIEVFDPPLPLSDIFFSRTGDVPPLQMTDKKGVWVVLNLWATWCSPCIAELPSLNRLARIQTDYVDVLAVSVDRKMDARRIAYYLDRWRLEALAPLHDTAGILPVRLDTERLPVTYIVGPDGTARAALYGRAKWESEPAQSFLSAIRDDPEFFMPYVKK